MRSSWRFVLMASLVTALACWLWPESAPAQEPKPVQWIWFDEGEPGLSAPAEARFFRRVFESQKAVDSAELEITADNSFTVWINGVEAGRGDQWQQVYRFEVRKQLRQGKNVLAVEAANESPGPAALMVKLSYVATGQAKTTLVSDGSWKTVKDAPKGWNLLDFDDSKWKAPRVIGQVGKVGPWHVANAVPDDATPWMAVPAGFQVEQAVRKPRDRGAFSLVNMCFDARGRLLLSQEGGPILLCVQPDKVVHYQGVVEYCKQVRNSQGMCWVGDALLLVGDGPNGTGLYRCRDTDNDDSIDDVKLLHKFQGGMGEHGPHGIVHGPDGWLYLVIGNHAWATPDKLADNSPLTRWPKGTQGPDQKQAGTTEDVLLPRQNDASGHAANIRAPGGTIWRLDHEGKNLSLFSAGYRNQFDAAFAADGELFSFDSDMEWDEGLPWYRAVRVCHATPGSDFLWRTGAANTPNYYLDSLPPLVETGRGSPVGVEVYDHAAFPEKYRCLYVADWSLGIIYAVHRKRDGGSYRATAEKFCTGSPLNVTDLAVGPDGALYFTTGGRGTQGGVFRIVHLAGDKEARALKNLTPGLIGIRDQPQPLSAWGRASLRKLWDESPEAVKSIKAVQVIKDASGSLEERLKILKNWDLQQPGPSLALLTELAQDKQPEMRAHAIWSIGVQGFKDGQKVLVKALADPDALVRRRACEALVRARIEPPVELLGPVLVDKDRFVRTAARLVLQRIDAKQWTDRLFQTDSHELAREGIIALCKTGQAEAHAERIFAKLHETSGGEDAAGLLDHLRTIQLALVHTSKRPGALRGIALDCLEMFPHKDARVNRELAILLTHLSREKVLDEPVHRKLLAEMLKAKEDRPQQIHYFYCLRLLHNAWDTEEKLALLKWFDESKKWTGGHSFKGFLENILKDWLPALTAKDVAFVLDRFDKLPSAGIVMLANASFEQLPDAQALAALHERLGVSDLPLPDRQRAQTATIAALGRSSTAQAQQLLRGIGDKHPAQLDVVARALAASGPVRAENWDYLVRALSSTNKQVVFDLLTALKASPVKPKTEDGKPFRAVLLASARLDPPNRWRAVELLRHWTNDRQFGSDKRDWRNELQAWSRWFNQVFPKETPLANVIAEREPESKYKFKELLDYLAKDGQSGDVVRGRAVFEKASCLKCHKFGAEGEGIGPDLTTLKSRFKRSDVLEALLDPSKVVSDQYRSTTIVTKKGQQITGLAAPQGDSVTILQQDGTKTTLKKSEIDQQYASLVSVMPEKGLDALTLREIADLFAFLESDAKR